MIIVGVFGVLYYGSGAETRMSVFVLSQPAELVLLHHKQRRCSLTSVLQKLTLSHVSFPSHGNTQAHKYDHVGSEACNPISHLQHTGLRVVADNHHALCKPVMYATGVTASLWHKQGTVGAGLPVLGTLKHLVETGDKVLLIEGVLSGTLSFIFNTFGGDARVFSEVVAEAKSKGYTEPDPRDDLNGTDVARKVGLRGGTCGKAMVEWGRMGTTFRNLKLSSMNKEEYRTDVHSLLRGCYKHLDGIQEAEVNLRKEGKFAL